MDAKSKKGPRATISPEAEANRSMAACESESRLSPPFTEAAETPPARTGAPFAGKPAEPASRSGEKPAKGFFALGDFAALAERRSAALQRSQAALVEGLEELSVEMAALARSGLEGASRGASEMLAVTSFSDAVDLQLALAQKSLETVLTGSFQMAELSVDVARKAAELFFAELFAKPL